MAAAPTFEGMVERGRELPVLPGRLQRLADELEEERIPALDEIDDRVAALVELAYALRPQRFEGRVPTYGALLPPSGALLGELELDTSVHLIPATDLDLQFARRFADGVTSFAVRNSDGVSHLACFGRNMADEYDLVGLQSTIGGAIIQRHPGGQVRLFGPAGVVRWDGVTWYCDPPIDAWVRRLHRIAPDLPIDPARALLRFAVHELSARRIGATLIWRPTDRPVPDHRHEPLVHHAPRLRVHNIGEEAALAHALAQTDGAAVFDAEAALVALGIRLAPSPEAERQVDAMHGMRHTSARRYSHDDPDSIVIVVSEAGPVTLMSAGRILTSLDPGDERIG
jgi:hypothetical protein